MKTMLIMGYAGDEAKIVRYAKKYGKMAATELDEVLMNNGMSYILPLSREAKITALVGTAISRGCYNRDLWDRVSGSISPVFVSVTV